MRRKWKCGRWEGATDGGQHASTKLSLAEPSQTGMRAFPQVGAASTLGEAASQRPSARELWQGPGVMGDLALELGLGSWQHHTVCPSCTVWLSFLSVCVHVCRSLV